MSKFNKIILGSVAVFIFVIMGLLAPKWFKNPEVGCTMEAKICPDGSAVGRISPNCEFAPCPDEREICKDLCGDGICQESVCLAIGCPCPETPETCPDDCK